MSTTISLSLSNFQYNDNVLGYTTNNINASVWYYDPNQDPPFIFKQYLFTDKIVVLQLNVSQFVKNILNIPVGRLVVVSLKLERGTPVNVTNQIIKEITPSFQSIGSIKVMRLKKSDDNLLLLGFKGAIPGDAKESLNGETSTISSTYDLSSTCILNPLNVSIDINDPNNSVISIDQDILPMNYTNGIHIIVLSKILEFQSKVTLQASQLSTLESYLGGISQSSIILVICMGNSDEIGFTYRHVEIFQRILGSQYINEYFNSVSSKCCWFTISNVSRSPYCENFSSSQVISAKYYPPTQIIDADLDRDKNFSIYSSANNSFVGIYGILEQRIPSGFSGFIVKVYDEQLGLPSMNYKDCYYWFNSGGVIGRKDLSDLYKDLMNVSVGDFVLVASMGAFPNQFKLDNNLAIAFQTIGSQQASQIVTGSCYALIGRKGSVYGGCPETLSVNGPVSLFSHFVYGKVSYKPFFELKTLTSGTIADSFFFYNSIDCDFQISNGLNVLVVSGDNGYISLFDTYTFTNVDQSTRFKTMLDNLPDGSVVAMILINDVLSATAIQVLKDQIGMSQYNVTSNSPYTIIGSKGTNGNKTPSESTGYQGECICDRMVYFSSNLKAKTIENVDVDDYYTLLVDQQNISVTFNTVVSPADGLTTFSQPVGRGVSFLAVSTLAAHLVSRFSSDVMFEIAEKIGSLLPTINQFGDLVSIVLSDHLLPGLYQTSEIGTLLAALGYCDILLEDGYDYLILSARGISKRVIGHARADRRPTVGWVSPTPKVMKSGQPTPMDVSYPLSAMSNTKVSVIPTSPGHTINKKKIKAVYALLYGLHTFSQVSGIDHLDHEGNVQQSRDNFNAKSNILSGPVFQIPPNNITIIMGRDDMGLSSQAFKENVQEFYLNGEDGDALYFYLYTHGINDGTGSGIVMALNFHTPTPQIDFISTQQFISLYSFVRPGVNLFLWISACFAGQLVDNLPVDISNSLYSIVSCPGHEIVVKFIDAWVLSFFQSQTNIQSWGNMFSNFLLHLATVKTLDGTRYTLPNQQVATATLSYVSMYGIQNPYTQNIVGRPLCISPNNFKIFLSNP